jgi:hypothetical protein
MRHFYLILAFFSVCSAVSQDLADENILSLKEKYDTEIDLKCEIRITVDVEGLVIPEKEVYVEFSKDEKVVVKGKGLSLLPKRGTVEQFKNLLSTPMQAIFLSQKGPNMVYKLVSLDPSSDWITADIILDPEKDLIYEAVVNTRKHGTFTTLNQYDGQDYPSRTEVIFEVKKFKLPLKFIGGQQTAESMAGMDEDVRGKVILNYTYL